MCSIILHVSNRLNPYAEFSYDGTVLNPLEVLFVKVKGFQMQGGWQSAHMAATYDRWLSSNVSQHLQASNNLCEGAESKGTKGR